MIRAIQFDSVDNVATMIDAACQGDRLYIIGRDGVAISDDLTASGNIQFGHKVALNSVESGELIIKYGAVIGVATRLISAGEHVHVYNTESLRGRGDKMKG